MKVQYMSDLHLEFGDMIIPPVIGDVLVLAGDIGVGVGAVDWINEVADKFKDVIYILGNHEFYHNDVPVLITKLRTPGLFAPNVHFMDNDTITIDGIKFAATTLWADMQARAFFGMNDSRRIDYASKTMSLEKVQGMFLENKRFLLKHKDADVVITHHCPHINSIDTERYPDGSLNTGYFTNILNQFTNSEHLGDLSSNIKHWICGHTHSVLEYTKYGITVHNNCRGYVGYGKGPEGCEVEDFNPGAYFEVNK